MNGEYIVQATVSSFFLVLRPIVCFNAVMDHLIASIKELRSRLKESQQAFANRLGISSRAVANYEAGRTPTRKVLWSLTMLAGETQNADLGDVFTKAYNSTMQRLTSPTNDEEQAWVRMVLALLRNKDSVPELDKLGRSLLAAAESLMSASAGKAIATDTEEFQEAVLWARSQITPNAEQQLDRLAQDRCLRTGESWATAQLRVLLENPELYRKYQEGQLLISGGIVEDLSKARTPAPRKKRAARARKARSAKS
jgi:transcriptional regulator with XRE-family HTH domain